MIASRRGRAVAVAAALVPILALTLGLPGGATPPEPGPGALPADPVPLLCLFCGYNGTADFILNVALFAPLGVALRLSGWRAGAAALTALALSTAIEALQLGMPGRYTTVGDVAANTLGGGLGAVLAGTGPLSLLAPPSLGRQAALTGVVAAAWAGSIAAFGLSLPRTAYYGQWTAELGQYEDYEGAVLEAAIGGRPAPSRRLEPEVRPRAALLAGDTVTVTALAGPPPPGPAPIFSIYDDRQEEILFLGADGDDLVLKVRRRAADLRLARPQLRWRDAFAGTAPGDTLELAAWRHGRAGLCVRMEVRQAGTQLTGTGQTGTRQRQWCGAPAVRHGWMLLLDPARVPAPAWPVLDGAWIVGGAAVALAWAPGLGAAVAGAGVLVAVLLAGSPG